MATSFFDLPTELRCYIYERALSEVLEQPESPRGPMSASSSYFTFTSLTEVGSPFAQEVTALFRKKYSHSVHFYFDDVCKLHEFQAWAEGQEDLEDIRFCLRVPTFGHKYEDMGFYYCCNGLMSITAYADATWALINSQSGSEGWENMYENMYLPLVGNARRTTTMFTEFLNTLPKGFHRRQGEFRPVHDAEQTGRYLAVVSSPSTYDLKFTLYAWRPRVRQPYHSRLFNLVELSGRLHDLTFSGVDVATMQQRAHFLRDSPWSTAHRRDLSPDLDEEERYRMDTDSWGVPVIDESNSELNDTDDVVDDTDDLVDDSE